MMKIFLERKNQILGFAAVLIFCSCGLLKFKKSYNHDYIKIIDPRDGQTYKTIQIGEQIWMAENLNFETAEGSWCYDNDATNCEKYGRLYDWETANIVCPGGWRLPTADDFEILIVRLGGVEKIASYHAIIEGGSSGFDALFGGWLYNNGRFHRIGSAGIWWSSTKANVDESLYMGVVSYDPEVFMFMYYFDSGFSVRCIKN